jgi:hypothetical protein
MTDTGNDSKQLLCRTDSSHVMTWKGWQKISSDSPVFELFEDTNHTFLQWFGNDSLRKSLHQKLVLIRLTCSSTHGNVVYKPCISVRVGWVPGLGLSYHILSASENQFVTTPTDKGLDSHSNYSLIGVCLGLLGVMYVSALMIYLRSKSSHNIKPNDRIIGNQFQSDSMNTNTDSNMSSDYSRDIQLSDESQSSHRRAHMNEELDDRHDSVIANNNVISNYYYSFD